MWHQSKSDPRKVYNERHEVVGVMQTSEQAAHIVAAVNYYDKLTVRGALKRLSSALKMLRR